jgi:hypothetical protein
LSALVNNRGNNSNDNMDALVDLFELYMLYDICDNYSKNILRLNITSANKMSEYNERLYKLLPKIRVNAVTLVDSFDWLDSNLCNNFYYLVL